MFRLHQSMKLNITDKVKHDSAVQWLALLYHSKNVLGSNLLAKWSLSSLHVFLEPMWVFFRCSSFQQTFPRQAE